MWMIGGGDGGNLSAEQGLPGSARSVCREWIFVHSEYLEADMVRMQSLKKIMETPLKKKSDKTLLIPVFPFHPDH